MAAKSNKRFTTAQNVSETRSKAQRKAWKKRKAKALAKSYTVNREEVDGISLIAGIEPPQAEDDIAHEKLREEFHPSKWINAADTPAERQLRKAAMHAVMYSGGTPSNEEGLLKAAGRIRDQMAEEAARKEQLAGEGIAYKSWVSNSLIHPRPDGHENYVLGKSSLAELTLARTGTDSVGVNDPVNHPAHYLRHPSGVECIAITEHFNFNRGNAIKYIWRADEKDSQLENLRKARWYLNREIQRLEKESTK